MKYLLMLTLLVSFSAQAKVKVGQCYKYENEYFKITSLTQYGANTYFYNKHTKWWLSWVDLNDMQKVKCSKVPYKVIYNVVRPLYN